MIKLRQRYEVLKRNTRCFGCLGKLHSVKDCKVSPCGISGCDKKHNNLLHERNGNDRTDLQQVSINSYSMAASSGSLSIVREILIDPDIG